MVKISQLETIEIFFNQIYFLISNFNSLKLVTNCLLEIYCKQLLMKMSTSKLVHQHDQGKSCFQSWICLIVAFKLVC